MEIHIHISIMDRVLAGMLTILFYFNHREKQGKTKGKSFKNTLGDRVSYYG